MRRIKVRLDYQSYSGGAESLEIISNYLNEVEVNRSIMTMKVDNGIGFIREFLDQDHSNVGGKSLYQGSHNNPQIIL